MSDSSGTLLRFITSKDSLDKYRSLAEGFRPVYMQAFPDENEREDYEVILRRIAGKPSADDPYTFLIVATGSDGKGVLGGLIGDWYEHCKAIHLTYIAVDPSSRGKNTGKKMLTVGIDSVKRIVAEENGIELGNIYFESNIPWKTKTDSFDPATRLAIFSKMGARWTGIDYVQPALERGKSRVRNLFLLTFPDRNNSTGCIDARNVSDFLFDLYKGLGIPEPERDEDFSKMADELGRMDGGNLVLKEIPVEESSSYRFSRASVALQFIEEFSTGRNLNKNTSCRYFNSYETDLMNFRYQKERPFETQLIHKSGNSSCRIEFPPLYSYVSEGRIETRHSTRNTVDCSFSLSCTEFIKDGTRIWNLVLSPRPGEWFSETDLIKLATFFGSSQEESSMHNEIKFADNGETYSAEDFICSKTGEGCKRLFHSGTGLIEIDTSMVETVEDIGDFRWEDFYSYLVLTHNRDNSLLKLEKKIEPNESLFHFLKVTCGIILGIFDFERMGIEEIEDTVNPVEATDSYYTVLSRGNLLCMGHEEEMLGSVYTTIGINPYLLIPGALLCYNEYVTEEAMRYINSALDEVNETGITDVTKLSEVRRKVEHNLNNRLLGNIFQYPTEITIYNSGIIQRQLDRQHDDLRKKIKELTDIIDAKNKLLDSKAKAIIALMLMILSCVGLYARFEALIKDPLLTWIALILFTIPVSVLVYRMTVSQK